MTNLDIIKRAGKNLRQAKGRTFLTSLAIAVGATTITLALAAGAGGRDYVDRQLVDRGIGETGYISIDSRSGMVEEDRPGVQPYVEGQTPQNRQESTAHPAPDKPFTPDKIAELQQISGIQELRFSLEIKGLYVSLDGQDQRFIAPNLDTQSAIYPVETTTGVFEDNLEPGQTIVTQDYTEAFGFTDPNQAVGKKLSLTYLDQDQQPHSIPLTITGVIKSPDHRDYFTLSYEDALDISEKQLGPIEQQSYYHITAIPEKNADIAQIVSQIQDLGHFAISDREIQSGLLEAVNVVQWGLVGFGALALLASIFGIINTQYISVLERTQQIGLMRAVGASRRDINRLFRYEAAWIGFLGATIGILIAMSGKLIEPVLKSFLEMPDDFTILIFEPLSLLAIVGSLMLVAVSAGFFPARRAAKLDPIEALRTE